jgi:hypothetical protein
MQLDELLFILPLPLMGLHLAAIPIFVFLIWKHSIRAAAGWLVFLVLESVAAVFLSVYASGMFGLGGIMACLALPTAIVSLLVLLILLRRFFQAFEQDQPRRRFYLIGGLIIVVLQAGVFVGQFGVKSACFAQTRRRAAPIIAAVESYRQEHGSYPHELEEIPTTSLPDLESPACGWSRTSSASRAGFTLEQCEPNITLLTVRAIDGDFIRRYNFSTENWSTVSFLDGTCSYLR